jgi:hypothetical protein
MTQPETKKVSPGVRVAGGRHPSVALVARWFDFDHLNGHLRIVSQQIAAVAQNMVDDIPDDPQLVLGLQKLVEAKDCFVRAALAGMAELE